jgi:hypothetical protein
VSDRIAKDEFVIGNRVFPTANAVRVGAAKRPGTVVGFSRRPDCLRVRQDDRKSVDTYHVSHWSLTPTPERPNDRD